VFSASDAREFGCMQVAKCHGSNRRGPLLWEDSKRRATPATRSFNAHAWRYYPPHQTTCCECSFVTPAAWAPPPCPQSSPAAAAWGVARRAAVGEDSGLDWLYQRRNGDMDCAHR
jgi:hypothetical protein